ncbi:hypothetical protein SNE40_015029 [Patella caerulea]|uniref:TNFR-Cys domain-containing protein n=1 Tax=Patella caerulea TaxID=87958 RepID=A0AAN8JG33_PATCE
MFINKAVLLFITTLYLTKGYPSQQYESPNGLTCQMCPGGTHLTSPCSIQHGTSICTTCPPLTFSSEPNKALSCASCTICQRGQRKTFPCSTTRDTICECPEGHFWQIIVEDQGICRPHSRNVDHNS